MHIFIKMELLAFHLRPQKSDHSRQVAVHMKEVHSVADPPPVHVIVKNGRPTPRYFIPGIATVIRIQNVISGSGQSISSP